MNEHIMVSTLKQLQAAAGLLVCLTSTLASAQADTRFEQDLEDDAKPWAEVAVQLPKLPEASTLVSFYVSPIATQTFAIAPQTLSIGSDGVIRYVLVARSESGAENISYEGLRCATHEHKRYAFGHQDGSWTRARRDQWEQIVSNAANRPDAALAEGYLCDGNTIASNLKTMIDRLKNKKPLTPARS